MPTQAGQTQYRLRLDELEHNADASTAPRNGGRQEGGLASQMRI
jgi:hypothetical protein